MSTSNFASFSSSKTSDNTTLITGHRYIALLGAARFSATLEVEHPVNGQEIFTPEFNMMEAMEPHLASSDTIIGMNQRTAIETAMQNDTDSLKREGLPEDLPVYLYAEVWPQFQPEAGKVRLNVAQEMNQFDGHMKQGNGKFYEAYKTLLTNPCNALSKPMAILDAGNLVGEVVENVPGVTELVLEHIPAAKG